MFAEMRNQPPRDSDRLVALEDRLERMVLVSEAMWALLTERTGVTVEQLEAKVHELDMASGRPDGRRARSPLMHCSKCDAALDRTRTNCAFCGADAPPANPFDRI